MYSSIFGYPCTRLADKDKLIGCSSSRFGSHGALWPIEEESDVAAFVKSNDGTRIAVFNSTAFTKDAVQNIMKSQHLQGIMVLPGPRPLQGFSPEQQYPNQKFGLYPNSDYVWNPLGNGMNYEQFNIPIFFIPSGIEYYNKIHTRAKENSLGKSPKWGVRLNSWMHASGPSDVCMRRGQCDPLGGKSVWTTLTGSPVDPQQRIIMVITQSDANALFHDLAIGGDAGVSGRASLLLAAEALTRTLHTPGPNNPFNGVNTQVIFAFFEGEKWGYLGSKRFVRDIVSFSCDKEDKMGRCLKPFATTLKFKDIDFNKIDYILEVGQVGNLSSNGVPNIFVHSDSQNSNTQLLNSIDKAGSSLGVSTTAVTGEIPPSALMAFLKVKQIPSVVLTEYEKSYTNNYYGSRFDDYTNINIVSLVHTADVVANTIINLINSSYPLNNSTMIRTNGSLASNLVNCLANNLDCNFFRTYIKTAYSSDPTSYVGVWGPDTISSIPAKFTHDFLFDLTRSEIGKNCSEEECDSGFECIRDFCMKSGTYYHDALTIGLNFDYDKWKFDKTPLWETESTWTESRWDSVYGELYEIPSSGGDIAQFVVGIVYLVATFAFVYALKINLIKRFQS